MERTEAQKERDLWLLVIGASVTDPVLAAALLGKELSGLTVPSEFVDLVSILSSKNLNRKAVRGQFAATFGVRPAEDEGMMDAVANTLRDKGRMKASRNMMEVLAVASRTMTPDDWRREFEKVAAKMQEVWK